MFTGSFSFTEDKVDADRPAGTPSLPLSYTVCILSEGLGLIYSLEAAEQVESVSS